ncbi:hypothetical protein T552_01813 [Pneumocystis carinii B80]|uniref:Cohesin loading factor n=1 Tax=Pneumocystis carinii (strain B80) TaxID=1408658 RepID=A0A0W4ZJK3_PNEC8|nr:hypothetical protein T552_01813 [Pneumocystis carinii B80]KTW28553.1 hypothetical protein T552_01813 [Pneumocystis carinii B80]
MLAPHIFLWSVAEKVFSEARRKVLFSKERFSYEEYYKLIATGLGCLETLLCYDRLETNIEIRTRFRMAEIIFYETEDLHKAEWILSKGVILAQRKNEDIEMRFAMQHLQIRILARKSLKTAQILLKSCIEEAEERQMVDWVYIFLFLQFDILSDAVNQESERMGRLSALMKIICIAEHRNDDIVCIIARLLETYLRIESEEYQVAKKCLNCVSAIQEKVSNISFLNIIKMMFNIFLNLIQGYGKEAVHELKDLHHELDAFAEETNCLYQDTYNLPLSQNGLNMKIYWFDAQQLFIYGHILSGMCYLPDYSSSKAEVFFNEGLEMLRYDFAYHHFLTNDLRTNKGLDWVDITRQLCLIYYCFALMLRSKFNKAFECIQILENYSSSFTITTRALFMLLKGTYAQFTGQLDIALKAYESIPVFLHAISLVGNLNSVLIFQGNSLQDKKRVYEILHNIEPLCQSSSFTQLKFAWNLISGSAGKDVLYSKNFLSYVVSASEKHTNTQFRVMALIALCYYFVAHSESEQAEKMLVSAYLLSKNAENDIWAFMSGKLLQELMKKKNKNIKAEKQLQLNLKHKERILDIFNNTNAISLNC